ncbi:MAG: hypothetical protein ABSA33_04825 [Candidatus Micrarchaeaceae archaeon]
MNDYTLCLICWSICLAALCMGIAITCGGVTLIAKYAQYKWAKDKAEEYGAYDESGSAPHRRKQ